MAPSPPARRGTRASASAELQSRTAQRASSYASSQMTVPKLREAIGILDSRVAALQLQRVELVSYLERAVRSHSPVNRIPAEILAEIFEMGVLAGDEQSPSVMVSTILLVCRFWRDVGISTPTLWTKILVSPHSSTKQISLKLARSQTCPLDVAFSFEARLALSSSTIMNQITRAMDLIKPALRRTRSFHVHVPQRAHSHAILTRCHENAPCLEEFSVHVEHSIQDSPALPSLFPLFNNNTPRLQHCSFSSFNFGWHTSILSNLRTLKLGGYILGAPSPTTMVQILRNCPSLEELVLRNISAYDGGMYFPKEEIAPPLCTKPVHLPRLKKASFYYSGPTLTNYIITNVNFPALEDLELYYLENVDLILMRLSVQAQISLPLRRLHIESCAFSESHFASFLKKTFSLISLELVDIDDISSALLKSLSATQPIPAPRLTKLVLDQCTNFSWDSLHTFVETRCFLSARTQPPHHGSSVTGSMHAGTQLRAYGPRFTPPCRLESLDVTRCTQLGREMIQWLRMYVPNVSAQPGKRI